MGQGSDLTYLVIVNIPQEIVLRAALPTERSSLIDTEVHRGQTQPILSRPIQKQLLAAMLTPQKLNGDNNSALNIGTTAYFCHAVNNRV